MKVIRVHAYGGPEVLQVEEAEVPHAGPGQALLRIEAVGVNFVDIYHRTGLYKMPVPFTLGTEAAGTVEAVGPGVTTVRPGDRVGSVNVLGAYAEYALAPADRLVPLPDKVSTRQAAAVLLQGITAQYLTTSTFPIERGQTCLVHAAAGGVGLLLCQMAKRRGARVIGTVSTEEKAALAREAGADEVILYTQDDFETEVKRLTGRRRRPRGLRLGGTHHVRQGTQLSGSSRHDGALRAEQRAGRAVRAAGAGAEGLALPYPADAWPLHREPRRAARARRAKCWAGWPSARWRCASGTSSR